jgi:hypothetical protein
MRRKEECYLKTRVVTNEQMKTRVSAWGGRSVMTAIEAQQLLHHIIFGGLKNFFSLRDSVVIMNILVGGPFALGALVNTVATTGLRWKTKSLESFKENLRWADSWGAELAPESCAVGCLPCLASCKPHPENPKVLLLSNRRSRRGSIIL